MRSEPNERIRRILGSASTSSGKLEADEQVVLGALSLQSGDSLPSRESVEPFLSALLQVEHLNLLVGSGLTTALAEVVGCKDVVDMNAKLTIDNEQIAKSIENAAAESAIHTGRGLPNIEDRLRIAIAAADGICHFDKPRAKQVQDAVDTAITSLRDTIWKIECALREGMDKSGAGDMSVHGLLMAFLASFAGRTPTRDRLHVFTTNYDRVLEWGAELAGLRIIDRFVGSLQPIFRSSRLELDYHYSPPGSVRDPRYLDGVLRLTKLHGSLDWRSDRSKRRVVRVALPFGEQPDSDARELLIYPQASKDIETNFYPYGDLFRDFSAALCRPHSALVTYGYSFGDDHINRIIKDMLTIPSTHLLVISYDDASERIKRFASDHRRLGQISVLIGPGMANLRNLVEKWLPRPLGEFLLQKRAEICRERNTGADTTAGGFDGEPGE